LCRIYRYNPPHPRSELLRVEFVFRRGLAKDTCRAIVETGDFGDVVARLGNTYGFTHPDWQPPMKTDEKMRVPIVKRETEGTIRWLYSQVAPAIRRCLQDGSLDMQHYIDWVYDGEKSQGRDEEN